MSNPQPTYYAQIPAPVRYSGIEANAKLLYGEITCLSNKHGYCFAGNSYFADLYRVSESTIRRWIKSLSDHGFIKVKVKNTANGTTREITINPQNTPPLKNEQGGAQNRAGGALKNKHHNNININNKKTNTRERDFFNQDFIDEEIYEFSEGIGLDRDQTFAEFEKWREYLSAYPDKAPAGDMVNAFKGWLRRAKPQRHKTSDTTATTDQPEAKPEDWDLYVRLWKNSGAWDERRRGSPEPNHPDTKVPSEILDQYNIETKELIV